MSQANGQGQVPFYARIPLHQLHLQRFAMP